MIAVAATPFCPPGIPVILAAAAALAAVLPWPSRARRPGERAWRLAGVAAVAVTGTWIAVLVTAGGCYALKLAGLAVPARWLDHPRAQRFAALVPVALLAGLVAVQATARGRSLTADPAVLAGLGAAVVALLLRAPFLVVIVAAAGTAAGLRALGAG